MGCHWKCVPLVISFKKNSKPFQSRAKCLGHLPGQAEMRVFGNSHTDDSVNACQRQYILFYIHAALSEPRKMISDSLHKPQIGTGLHRLDRPILTELLSRMRPFSEVDIGLNKTQQTFEVKFWVVLKVESILTTKWDIHKEWEQYILNVASKYLKRIS